MATQAQCTSCQAPIPTGSAFCSVCGAQQPAGCADCGAPLAPGAAFCAACGAAVAFETAQPAAARSTCASCQAELPAGAAFCGNCGTAVSAAPAPPPATANCPNCGAPLREGKRFCRQCGTPVAGTAPAAAQAAPAAAAARGHPRPLSVQTVIDQLTWSSAAAGVGFIIAALSPFLTWASAPGIGVSPFDSGARFRLGEWLGSDAIDGPATVFIALGGLAMLIAVLLGRLDRIKGRNWIAGVGAALAVLGLIEMQFVISRPGSIDIGFGLYLLVLGGLVAAASPWIPERPLKGQ